MVTAKITELDLMTLGKPATAEAILNGQTPAGYMTKEEIEAMLRRKVATDEKGVPILSDRDRKVLVAQLALNERFLNNPTMSVAEKASLLKTLRMKSVSNYTDEIGNGIAASDDLKAWLAKPLTLEKADGSQMHKMLAACHARKLIIPINERAPSEVLHSFDAGTAFVVQHDWSAAFKDAKDFDQGEFHLPFDQVCFEFRISGRRVMVNCQDSETRGLVCVPVIETVAGWMMPLPFEYLHGSFVEYPSRLDTAGGEVARAMLPLMNLVLDQIRAISISLEAEVAEVEVVRADYKLNRAREKRGKLPIADYHVISLARRTRIVPLPRDLDPDREITRKRLHFRRGHWRHYENHKVWIKWTLVGDPDLGWIDKHYKL